MIRRLLGLALAAATLAVVPANAASADNPPTPRDFRGHGFDQCVAPTQAAMDAWLERSPFLAVGIYVSGASRGCRTQPNLTPTWVSTQLRKGWRLLPITLGPQAACHPSFPRYGNDPTIDDDPGRSGGYPNARRQARNEADTAVAANQRLGIVAGSTLWYDLEGFDVSRTRCRESALAFLSAWTTRVHAQGYVSGVYSSAATLQALDNARVQRPTAFTFPDRIWVARWDGVANTSTSYLREDGWRPGGRVKQYRGGHNETWGGVTINIDSNWLDLGNGAVAPSETHCGGTQIDFASYPQLAPGTRRTRYVKALQCLLSERGFYAGKVHGFYGPAVVAALNAWQRQSAISPTSTLTSTQWQRLHAQGSTLVLKTGSAGREVRRAQRSLNSLGAGLGVSGLYDTATRGAVLAYQKRVGLAQSGILDNATWRRLKLGSR